MLIRRLAFFLCCVALLWSATIVQARNVPGSAGAVMGSVDRSISSALVDLSVANAGLAPLSQCIQVPEPDHPHRLNSCEWGLSINGQVLVLDGTPSGYSFDSTTELGNVTISRWLNPQTAMFLGGVFETGDTDTNYNDGNVSQKGAGVTGGLIYHTSDNLAFILLTGLEWLNYDVSRSDGAFTGDYDALRMFGDAGLEGRLGHDDFWVLYRGSLRAIRQNNDSYWEKAGGVPTTFIDDIDYFTLSSVADLKLGTTFENTSLYLQLTGSTDIYRDASSSSSNFEVDDGKFNSRIGLGVDAAALSGLLSLSGGAHFDGGSFNGFDLRAGFSKNF